MESKTTQTFNLTEGDIKEAIIEWVEKKFGKGHPLSLNVHIACHTEGIGPGEHDVYTVEANATREVLRANS